MYMIINLYIAVYLYLFMSVSKYPPVDATAASQGAGSAFNRYLATVTRLTFALQVFILIYIY